MININWIKPRQALNKAFLKTKPLRIDINKFKKNMRILLNRINLAETEEFHKNLISTFLNDTYYKPEYFINTKSRNDMVIHTGPKPNSKVGVIIEAKSPKNVSEMPKTTDINAKALHELVLYFMEERITNDNMELKYLIITNLYEWFIFDATIFEKAFVNNKKFKKTFIKYKNNELSGTTTAFFYDSIVKPEIASIQNNFKYIHFNLQVIENIIKGTKKDEDLEIIPFFKIFSPEHLLKRPFINDNNSLDRKFYSELLYLIGLEEKKEDGKNVIIRNRKRVDGSFLELTIHQLKSSGKIWKLDLAKYGKTEDEKYFNVALGLVMTWINRILFLKLLESQSLAFHKNDKSHSFLNIDSIPDFSALNDVFFMVLAYKPEEREQKLQEKYAKVPYLNSSLFEQTEDESVFFPINQLKKEKMQILSSTVLKDRNGQKIKGRLDSLTYLLKFLSAYDFSNEGSEQIQEDNKTLINASVLGLIFEKINGYKDGSFFTPGYITQYMCHESIERIVIQKFNEAKGWGCITLTDVFNKISNKEIEEANEIINSIKICDPAVGSGHFLVSALNELIEIKSTLGILYDKNGKKLRDYKIEVINDDLIIHNEEELFAYDPSSVESQRIQEILFHEKQKIIENCLFGVDINFKSVNICRLRLWIELLKSTYYMKSNAGNRVLETLPNIDINIKCGNSLISRYNMDIDIKKPLKGVPWSVSEYRKAIMRYRYAQNKVEKHKMEILISNLKSKFNQTVQRNDRRITQLSKAKKELNTLMTQRTLKELTKEEKVEKQKQKQELSRLIGKLEKDLEEIKNNIIYQDSFEWRFEFPEILNEEGDFVGFDLIIGNPPYIYLRDLDENEKKLMKAKYSKSADDLYMFFTYRAIELLNSTGYLTLITPNTYFTLNTKKDFRKYLFKQLNLKLTYSGFCFKDAYVETMILLAEKAESGDKVKPKEKSKIPSKSKISFVQNPNDYENYETLESMKENFENNIFSRLFFPTTVNLAINEKVNKPSKGLAENFKNVFYGREYDKEKLDEYNSSLKAGDITLLGLVSEGEQGLVTGNNSKYIGKVISSSQKSQDIEDKFVKLLNEKGVEVTIQVFNNDKKKYYIIAEELKQKTKKPGLFGKFFIYKCIEMKNVRDYETLTKSEKVDGGDEDLWVYYHRGNKEGYRWIVPLSNCINWSKEYVKELRDGVKTNSRWQGDKYYGNTGFAWVDYFTDKIKAFFLDEGVYQKNTVKLHTTNLLISDKFIVALINSRFISYYVKNFITSTHTLQILDGRLIPIKIPDKETKNEIEILVTKIINAMKTDIEADVSVFEEEINDKIYNLYGLTKEQIKTIDKSFPTNL